jgi:hypothetical protein
MGVQALAGRRRSDKYKSLNTRRFCSDGSLQRYCTLPCRVHSALTFSMYNGGRLVRAALISINPGARGRGGVENGYLHAMLRGSDIETTPKLRKVLGLKEVECKLGTSRLQHPVVIR